MLEILNLKGYKIKNMILILYLYWFSKLKNCNMIIEVWVYVKNIGLLNKSIVRGVSID